MDRSGGAARRWNGIVNKFKRGSGQAKGLSGAALEQAVMALAAYDPSLVKIQAGAQ